MSRISKIVFRSTNGVEVSGSVRYDGSQDLVTLPDRIAMLVEHIGSTGDEHVLVLVERGFEYPLVPDGSGRYRVDRAHGLRPTFLQELKASVIAPTKDQRLQHGRYCHTLSASAVVGAVGYGAGLHTWTGTSAVNCASLLAFGVVLFAVGAVLSKGEK
jgi:hypothetical protein